MANRNGRLARAGRKVDGAIGATAGANGGLSARWIGIHAWLRRGGLALSGTALFLTGAAAGGVAAAKMAAPPTASSINGCVNTKTRALTVPKAGRTCPRGTTKL